MCDKQKGLIPDIRSTMMRFNQRGNIECTAVATAEKSGRHAFFSGSLGNCDGGWGFSSPADRKITDADNGDGHRWPVVASHSFARNPAINPRDWFECICLPARFFPPKGRRFRNHSLAPAEFASCQYAIETIKYIKVTIRQQRLQLRVKD
ncbi:hypothetical protein D3C80_1387290 [compost metagenome]